MMNGIPQEHKHNFQTLCTAMDNGDVALMQCTDKATGEKVQAVCAVNVDKVTGIYSFVPLARLFDTDPFETIDPPAIGLVL